MIFNGVLKVAFQGSCVTSDVGRPNISVHRVAKALDLGAAPTWTFHWFETELLTQQENLVALMAVNREVLAQVAIPMRADRIVLDMDSSESPVHGAQEVSVYTGHFESICYHRCVCLMRTANA